LGDLIQKVHLNLCVCELCVYTVVIDISFVKNGYILSNIIWVFILSLLQW